MTDPKDYSSKVWVATATLILLLVGVSFIPPFEVWGVGLRRANILSELITFEPKQELPLQEEVEVEEIDVDWAEVSAQVAEHQQPEEVAVERNLSWEVEPEELPEGALSEESLVELSPRPAPAVPIENFDTTLHDPLKTLYGKLARRERVRIAFLGDSFVEGDILTADLREALQEHFGGAGAGFAPIASPLTGFRRTIKTQAKGWSSYNVMQQAKSPEQVQPNFTITGWVCTPEKGAVTRWEMTDARRHLTPCRGANLWFRSEERSTLRVTLNDTLQHHFEIEGEGALRQISLSHPELRSLEVEVIDGASGFMGYGAQFHGNEGVTLDNYSVRSNNGRALFWTSPALNAQLHQVSPYDLVILQYGLNIMQQGVYGYSRYAAQLEQMVAYVRECFPGVAILLLGVSERWVKGEQGFAPMDAIPSMLEWQRRAAEKSGVAFWNTCEAMRAQGGMEHFVAQGWAGKDYTHINFGGGRRIAQELFEALYAGAYEAWQEEQRKVVRRGETPQIERGEAVDSLLFGQLLQPIE